MGAMNYENVGKGKTAREVFDRLTDQAKWAHGHGGYTGTIAAKDSYVEFKRPKGMRRATVIKAIRAVESIRYGTDGYPLTIFAERQFPSLPIAKMFAVYDDKWGPSLAIEVSKGEYLFAGIASE